MESITNVYYYVAIFATVFYVIKMFLFAVFGGDMEVHADFNTSFETEDSFDFLSIQSILAFLMGFGWMGLTCIKVWSLSTVLSVICSIGFGLLLLLGSSYLMFCVKKLNKIVKKNMSMAINASGRAYTSFEPNGEGQIEININNQLSIEDAVNTSEDSIKAFDAVKVIKYENNKLYITKE